MSLAGGVSVAEEIRLGITQGIAQHAHYARTHRTTRTRLTYMGATQRSICCGSWYRRMWCSTTAACGPRRIACGSSWSTARPAPCATSWRPSTCPP
jgi:hypothetical protein